MAMGLVATVADSQTQETFEVVFDRFPVRIGRNQLNDLQINRPYVSQFHISIELTGTQIIVRDLGSTNGTLYLGQKLQREQPVDVTRQPEVQIGPVHIRLTTRSLQAAESVRPEAHRSILDINTAAGAALLESRKRPIAPGAEDSLLQQVTPYYRAYREAWTTAYRVIYDHLGRLDAATRERYIGRLLREQVAFGNEPDMRQVAEYYGVAPTDHGELQPVDAAAATVRELARALMPDLPTPQTAAEILSFGQRLRDVMDVFLRCFVSLRDGYKEFETEVLRKQGANRASGLVDAAPDAKALATALLAPDAATEDACHQLHETFVEVMTHQVAMLNGVMEGVRQLLEKLSPQAIEQAYEQHGKKGFLSNRHEGLWQLYRTVHADYQGEDKETFLIIFGPQFSRAYAATAGEAY